MIPICTILAVFLSVTPIIATPPIGINPSNQVTTPPNDSEATPTNVVRPLCPPSADICETSLYLRDEKTGMDGPPSLVADGVHKLVKVFNRSLPGPPIVVYEGQQVVVRVVNGLDLESTTVHWHGVNQERTPWMDGADGVSHCPILPGHSFTYRFMASTSGTFWYHSHHGTQRTMGAAGPLVVLPRTDERQRELRGSDQLPQFDGEFILVVTDWMRNHSGDVNMMVHYEMVSYPFGYDSDSCFNSTKQADGMDCGVFPYSSGLINGKGRYYLNGSSVFDTPLERFKVKAGGRYRFRVICTSMTFSFRLSIDGHDLHVIATDGNDVISTQVESVVVASGERYDFWVDATDPTGTGNYWIRAETLERFQNAKAVPPGHIEAVLQYGETAGEPNTTRRTCTKLQSCHVLNCPYRFSLPHDHMTCLHVTDLRATSPTRTLAAEPDNFVEHFLNFHFVGLKTRGAWKPSINGYINQLPTTPYQLGGTMDTPCNRSLCAFDECRCPHVLHAPLGSVVQLVLAITVSNPAGVLNGNSHPVHIHGHTVQVIKTAFPTYNPDTNFFTQRSRDLECIGVQESCNQLRWADPAWAGGQVGGAIQEAPPTKDTVVIPVGGYVVVRFKANNPGYWYMHCHVEFHNSDGMALVIKEGEESDMVPPPEGLPRCHDFHFADEEEQVMEVPAIGEAECPSFYKKTTILLLGVVVALLICSVCEWRLMRKSIMSAKGSGTINQVYDWRVMRISNTSVKGE